jgi:hypothetical protein
LCIIKRDQEHFGQCSIFVHALFALAAKAAVVTIDDETMSRVADPGESEFMVTRHGRG